MSAIRKFSLLAALLVSTCAHAQIYECIDANGKKSYASECPANSAKAKEVHPQVQDAGKPVTPPEKTKAQEDAAAKQHAADKAKAAAKDKQAEDASNNAEACADAKSRLDALQSGRQARRVDPVTGEHVPLDDTARQNEIAGLNTEIANTCK